MLSETQAALVVVDVQGRLAQLVHEKEMVLLNIRRLIQSMNLLKVPIFWLEQSPEGLGPTVEDISKLLMDHKPIKKNSFSGCGSDAFRAVLGQSLRSQLILCGIEAHICVYQTAADLISLGYEVNIAVDAVSSRTYSNKLIGIHKMHESGAQLTSTETVLYELMRTSDHPQFKEILKLIK